MIELKAMSLSVANPVTTLKPPIHLGPIEVRGEITTYFESPALQRWFRQARARQLNEVLRYLRPHMPRRRWQRLRGRVKGAL